MNFSAIYLFIRYLPLYGLTFVWFNLFITVELLILSAMAALLAERYIVEVPKKRSVTITVWETLVEYKIFIRVLKGTLITFLVFILFNVSLSLQIILSNFLILFSKVLKIKSNKAVSTTIRFLNNLINQACLSFDRVSSLVLRPKLEPAFLHIL